MYLPQAISDRQSIGEGTNLDLCGRRSQENRFEPSVVAFGPQTHIWRQSATSKPDLTSAGSGQEHPHGALEVGAGYRNPAL